MSEEEGMPQCDTIDCVKYAVKYYRNNGFDAPRNERDLNLRALIGTGCKRPDGKSAVSCAMDAVWDMAESYGENKGLMKEFAEIAEWDHVQDPLCDRCSAVAKSLK